MRRFHNRRIPGHSSFLRLLLVIALATATLATCVDAADRMLDSQAYAGPLPRLGVHPNGRYLVTEDGEPFFWLGDTAWRLIQKAALTDQDDQPSVTRYFAARRSQGFNVLQTVVVRHANVVNSAGDPAFHGGDFTRPRVVEGPDNDYWDKCDAMLDLARTNRFYVALLPLWLNRIEDRDPIVRDPSIAYRYGHFLGERNRHRTNIIWVLGGDPYQKGRDVDQPKRLALVRAMAEGIADGVEGQNTYDGKAEWSSTLMTYHPKGGGHSSSETLHTEAWLDFNMVQTSTRFNFANYETISDDVTKTPPKPTLDAEVAYEYSLSLIKKESQDRRIGAWDVRRAAYWAVFAGGFGHTYGHRSFISWTRAGEHNRFGADIPWFEALDAPGAGQMRYLRQLMTSVAFLSRIPDQTVIAGDPGNGVDHARATRDAGGRYILVYLPTGRPVGIHMESLNGPRAEFFWFNPRDGSRHPAGPVDTRKTRRFRPPTSGNGQDWVLMIVSNSSNLTTDPPSEGSYGLQPSLFFAASAACLVGRAFLSTVARCRLVISAVDRQAGWQPVEKTCCRQWADRSSPSAGTDSGQSQRRLGTPGSAAGKPDRCRNRHQAALGACPPPAGGEFYCLDLPSAEMFRAPAKRTGRQGAHRFMD